LICCIKSLQKFEEIFSLRTPIWQTLLPYLLISLSKNKISNNYKFEKNGSFFFNILKEFSFGKYLLTGLEQNRFLFKNFISKSVNRNIN
jgi:hypothetical protein